MAKKEPKDPSPEDPSPPENSINQFLNELSGVLELLQQSKYKKLKDKEIPKEIFEKLAGLELQADLLAKINDQLFLESGIKKEDLETPQKDIKDLPEDMRKILNRTEQMRRDVAVRQGEAAADAIIAERIEKDKAKEAKTGQRRKKKFRGLDGGHWKPL